MAVYTLPDGGTRLILSKQGSTFTANSSGFIIRARRKPLLKRTEKASQQRVNFRNVVSSYRLMSPGEKSAWKSKAPQFTRINSLGVPYELLGNQLFQGLNQNRIQAGAGINETASDATVFPVRTIINSAFDITPVDISVVLDITFVPHDFTFNFFANFVNNASHALTFPNDYKFIKSFPTGTFSRFDFSIAYQAVFGNGPFIPAGSHNDWFIQIVLQSTYIPSGEKKVLDTFIAQEFI